MGRGGLKRGQQSQPDRRTDTHFFLETRTDHEQTRHRGTHILSLFPISSNSDPFRQHTQASRSTHVPRPRARIPHRRSADSARRRAEPSLLSQVHAVLGRVPHAPCSRGMGSLAPSSVLESFSSPFPVWISYGAQSDAGRAPTLFRSSGSRRCKLLCNPPSRLAASLNPPFHSFCHSFIHPFLLVPPSFIHSPPAPPASAFHSFIPSFIHFPGARIAHTPPKRPAARRRGPGEARILQSLGGLPPLGARPLPHE